MGKELVISSNRHETRVAILEDDQLVEIYFQRANEYSLAGSIHKGRVTRVLPGMQSAFVDLGLERDTFLYVSDFFEENGDEYDAIDVKDSKPPRQSALPPRSEPVPVIVAPVEPPVGLMPVEDAPIQELAVAPVASEAVKVEDSASWPWIPGIQVRFRFGRLPCDRAVRG
jgi:Rne/Rng family ribonuclease